MGQVRRFVRSASLFALAAFAAPASAKIASIDDNGFYVVHLDDIDASPAEIWTVLVEPSLWWNSANSFSGESIYFSLEPRVGGCFCEKIPKGETEGGDVRHMVVVYTDKPRVLRMQGALGPLQSEAVNGTMTFAMDEGEKRGTTRLSLSYVVGGYMRRPVRAIAGSIDDVTGDALQRLKAVAEGRDPAAVVYVPRSSERAGSAEDDDEPEAEAPADTPADTALDATEEPTQQASPDGGDAADEIPSENDELDAEDEDAETEEAAEAEAASPPVPSLSERLDLMLDEDEVEIAGSGSDTEAEADETDPSAAADAAAEADDSGDEAPAIR